MGLKLEVIIEEKKFPSSNLLRYQFHKMNVDQKIEALLSGSASPTGGAAGATAAGAINCDFKQGLRCVFTEFGIEHYPLWNPASMVYQIYQLERGQETDRLHFQGFTIFKNNVRYNKAQEEIGLTQGRLSKAWSDTDTNIKYCSKKETRIDGPWEFGTVPKSEQGKRNDVQVLGEMISQGHTIMECFKNPLARNAAIRYKRNAEEFIKMHKRVKYEWEYPEPNEFQKFWIQYLVENEPDKRKIIFICNPKGGIGKTELAKAFLAEKSDETIMIEPHIEMKRVWTMYKEKTRYVFINVGKNDSHDYTMYEKLKDGNKIITMYESSQELVKKPHVIVLCNTKPDITKLSEDRFDIRMYE